jgi:hypothetical protein
MLKHVTAKLGNMRKPQDFVVYPGKDGEDLVVQSDKSIGKFNRETGKGVLNTKGCYFPHLTSFLGAKPYDFPMDFVVSCVLAQPESGDLIGTSSITGPVYVA